MSSAAYDRFFGAKETARMPRMSTAAPEQHDQEADTQSLMIVGSLLLAGGWMLSAPATRPARPRQH